MERPGVYGTLEIANVLVSALVRDSARHRANHIDAPEDWYRAGRAHKLVRGDDGYWREEELPNTLPSHEAVVIGFRGIWFYPEVFAPPRRAA